MFRLLLPAVLVTLLPAVGSAQHGGRPGSSGFGGGFRPAVPRPGLLAPSAFPQSGVGTASYGVGFGRAITTYNTGPVGGMARNSFYRGYGGYGGYGGGGFISGGYG